VSRASPDAWSFSAFRHRPGNRLWLRRTHGEPLDPAVPRFAVRRFTEKPALASRRIRRERQLPLERRHVLLARLDVPRNLKRHLPQTHAALEKLVDAIGARTYEKKLRAIYPKLENISVTTPSSNAPRNSPALHSIRHPAEIGWSDIGSWAAVYELLAKKPAEMFSLARATHSTLPAISSTAFQIHRRIGVHDLVVVETPDAFSFVLAATPRTSPNSSKSSKARNEISALAVYNMPHKKVLKHQQNRVPGETHFQENCRSPASFLPWL